MAGDLHVLLPCGISAEEQQSLGLGGSGALRSAMGLRDALVPIGLPRLEDRSDRSQPIAAYRPTTQRRGRPRPTIAHRPKEITRVAT